MHTHAYFKIRAEHLALKTMGNVIAKEVLQVMSLGKPWVTSQRWGTLDVYANTYKDISVRVEHKGLPVLVYMNGTTFMRAGLWTDEIRKHCLHQIYDLTYQIGLVKQQEGLLSTTANLLNYSKETTKKEK